LVKLEKTKNGNYTTIIRKEIMKIKITVLLLFIGLVSLFSDEIQWIEDYDLAKSMAEESGQNIFLLLTAPSWCGYCQWMEENTLQEPEVIDMLNNQFIACKILDTNAQVDRFEFKGYPTTRVYSAQGEKLAEGVGSIGPESYISRFQSYGKESLVQFQETSSDNPVKLYGKESSTRTQALIEYFTTQGIDYEFHDVNIQSEKEEIKSAIQAFGFNGTIYLPIIIIDGMIYFPPS